MEELKIRREQVRFKKNGSEVDVYIGTDGSEYFVFRQIVYALGLNPRKQKEVAKKFSVPAHIRGKYYNWPTDGKNKQKRMIEREGLLTLLRDHVEVVFDQDALDSITRLGVNLEGIQIGPLKEMVSEAIEEVFPCFSWQKDFPVTLTQRADLCCEQYRLLVKIGREQLPKLPEWRIVYIPLDVKKSELFVFLGKISSLLFE